MPFDAMSRRSRFKRTPTGKRLVRTDRDLAILQWLYRYRYLTATQLSAILKPRSNKRFIERLGDLFHETALINRPPAQWRSFDARYRPITYELSPSGVALLEHRNALTKRATTFSRRAKAGRAIQFDHAMMVVEALLAVELATIAKLDQRFVPVDEILERAPEQTCRARNPLAIPVTLQPCADLPGLRKPWQTHIIPDALYGIEYQIDGDARYRFWALECENTTPKRRSLARNSSIARKHAAYDALLGSRVYRDHWGIPNLKLHLISREDIRRATAIVS